MHDFVFNFFKLISFFGGEIVVAILATLISFIIIFTYRKKRLASFIFFNYGVTLAVVILIKFIVQKPRNPLALVKESSYAFPSGHAALAMISCLIFFFLAGFVKNKFWKNFLKIFGILWLILTISARLYLKVHDPLDIITSLLIAAFIFLISTKIKTFRKDYLAKEFAK